MNRRLLSLLASLALVIGVFSFGPAQTASAAGGTFWLYSGADQTGEARGFYISPERLVRFTDLRYNQNCSGTCDLLNNTVSSIRIDCSTWDDSDYLQFFNGTDGTVYLWTFNPQYPGWCVNGSIKYNLPTVANNLAGSITTNE